MKHTSTPWKYEEGTESNPPALVMNTETYICQTVSGNDNANAEFIVRAVNNHYQLLDALKELEAAEWMITADWGGDRESVLDIARKAIKEAE